MVKPAAGRGAAPGCHAGIPLAVSARRDGSGRVESEKGKKKNLEVRKKGKAHVVINESTEPCGPAAFIQMIRYSFDIERQAIRLPVDNDLRRMNVILFVPIAISCYCRANDSYLCIHADSISIST